MAPALWAVDAPVRSAYSYFGWDEAPYREAFAGAATRLSDAMPAR